MKRYVELGLAALLAVLIYEKPNFLLSATHSTLGKIILIIIVGLLSKQFGLNAGLLAAIIMIVLLETNREGLESNSESDINTNISKGKSIGSASIKNIACEDCGCKHDTDCAACNKTAKEGDNGQLVRCSCNSTCEKGKCKCKCNKKGAAKGKEAKTIEGYDNINQPLHPGPVFSGTDQIGLDRQIKLNAEYAKNAASQQPNGFTNN